MQLQLLVVGQRFSGWSMVAHAKKFEIFDRKQLYDFQISH